MKPKFHRELTEAGLKAESLLEAFGSHTKCCRRGKREKALVALEPLLKGNLHQDRWIPLNQAKNHFHVDCSAFRRTADYLHAQWAVVTTSDRELQGCCDIDALTVGLVALGRILHAVQDFYSHSTWVEAHDAGAAIPVWDWRTDPTGLALARQPWNAETWARGQGPLVSGTWFVTPRCRRRADTDWPEAARKGPAPSHAKLNKDSPDTPQGRRKLSTATLHDRAMQGALTGTVAELRNLRSACPALVRAVQDKPGCGGCSASVAPDVGHALAAWRDARSASEAAVAFTLLEVVAPDVGASLRRSSALRLGPSPRPWG